MRWRSLIYLGFVNIILIFYSCNCGDTVENDDNVESEVVRVNNGYATKDINENFKIKRCDKNYADCNNDVKDGCESNIRTDHNNCGGCGNVCKVPENVSSIECRDSKCVIDYCISGYVDLDKNYDNGCEYKCFKVSEKEIPSNMVDDDCDGFIDNICSYEVDSTTYNIASDINGRISGLFSAANSKYLGVTFVESLLSQGSALKISVLNSDKEIIFTNKISELPLSCNYGSVVMDFLDDSIDLFWSENCDGKSKIIYLKMLYSGIILGEPFEIYNGFNPVTNIIVMRYNNKPYISFETIENRRMSIFLAEIDTIKGEMVSRKIVSNKELDSYGHNLIIEEDKVYVSYCEMKQDGVEVVIMENDLLSNAQYRYPIYKTSENIYGTSLGYGRGYFILMWTVSKTSVGTMYLSVLNREMANLLLKKVDFKYDEFGLPVTIYNGNIFGTTFQAIRNNRGYILFSDIDLVGKKISELIISPVSLLEKPYMTSIMQDFYIFYTDINTKMKYFLNMRKVYCRPRYLSD